jgi:hypothetical protein
VEYVERDVLNSDNAISMKYFYQFTTLLIGLVMSTKLYSQTPIQNKSLKENYQLVFDEDFSKPELNLKNWIPYYLPQWSSRAKSKPNFVIKDESLVLQITENQQPWCPEFNGNVKCSSIQTGIFAGELGSNIGQHQFFNPDKCVVREEQKNGYTYLQGKGYIEIRAKALMSYSNVVSLWMIGYQDQPEKSAELCVFEVKGWHYNENKATVGFGIHKFNDPNLKEAFYEDDFEIDVTQFHTYGVEWLDDKVVFYIDGLKTREINQSPQYPMQLMLGIYEIPAMKIANSVDKYPKEFIIDYVRGYQRNEK